MHKHVRPFLLRYDTEAAFFDEEVKNGKRKQLVSRALEVSVEHLILLQSSLLTLLFPAVERERERLYR